MNVVIIDTGCSNLLSIKTAIHNLGCTVTIGTNSDDILKADKLFLPGVGSAKTAMQKLIKNKLTKTIKNCTKPILGICLGMQLLGMYSEENNTTKTLGIINVPTKKIKYYKSPLPHTGWNQVIILKNNNHLFHKITNYSYFYFVHNFAMPFCNKATLSTTNYDNQLFTSAIQHQNFFGVQFHPEKSGLVGKQLIKNFLEI